MSMIAVQSHGRVNYHDLQQIHVDLHGGIIIINYHNKSNISPFQNS